MVHPLPYLEVAVNSPGGLEATYVYAHTADPPVGVGSLVLVPFGSASAQGIVVGTTETPPEVEIRPIIGLLDPSPILNPEQVRLARWIAEHYVAPLFDALALMLPPGAARRPETFLSLAPDAPEPRSVSEAEYALLAALRLEKRLDLPRAREVLTEHGQGRRLDQIIRRLVRIGCIRRETTVRPARVGPRRERFARLAAGVEETRPRLDELKRAPRQRATLDRLLREPTDAAVPLALLREEGLGDSGTLSALAEKGLIVVEEREVRRDPLAHRSFPRLPVPFLTDEQAVAWKEIEAALDGARYHPFLLFGITGSGKTEVYLRFIEGLLARGKRAIVLVPEIALTPQTVQRFAGRFPGRVAVLHSKLSAGERFDEWRRVRSGEADVVVGSRSAVFAPVPDLGGIVVDEEHEWSYKSDLAPRYHAREVALKLAEIAGLPIILGSATPDLVTYHRAIRGELTLLPLRRRVDAVQGAGLPPVEVVDLRAELRAGNRSIFSIRLRDAIESSLRLREQVILFLNRRGDSTFVLCRDCGHVMVCRRCDAPLVYHSDVEDLVCHLCDAHVRIPRVCPNCSGDRIRYFGIGTQKLETEVRRAFPQARVLRWDRDSASAKGAHEELLRSFVNHEADVLVGTQMIAKGLDLPRVTLVGVISADTSLHLPDFRATERTFQLLTQVAGRAGRGPLGGKVIIQSYSPQHYCVQAARDHDYATFASGETRFRRQHGYPPFGDLARLVHTGYGEARVQREANQIATQIHFLIRRDALDGIDVIGPAPAFRRKIRGRYRWQIVLRGHHLHRVLDQLKPGPEWTIDVDPVSTL